MTTEIRPSAAQNKPSGKLYMSWNQLNLVSGVWTVVALNQISAGFTDGIENTVTHRIITGRAGIYDVKASICLTSVVADKAYHVGVRLNGVTFKLDSLFQAAVPEYLTCSDSAHVFLAADDYLELMAHSGAGVNTVDIYGQEALTRLSVQRER